MIHACTFRTALLRETDLQMPKHTFYEDNYMVYGNLRSAERLYYMNLDLQLMAQRRLKRRAVRRAFSSYSG